MSADLLAVLLAFLGASAMGAVMPRAIAALPEPPPPDPDDDRVPSGPAKAADAPPKPLYVDLAARPGLWWRLALVAGLAAAVMALGTGWDARLLPLVPVAAFGAALGYVDWVSQLLPTRLIWPAVALAAGLVVLAAVLAGDRDVAVRGAIGAVATFGVFFGIWFIYPRGMGYGDVRLSLLLGLVLAQVGWAELVVGMYGSFLVGGIGGLLLSLLKIVSRKRMPFGPFMLVSAVLAVPLGQPIVEALFGV